MHWRYRYGLKSLYFFTWAAWAALCTVWALFIAPAEHPTRTVFIIGFLIPGVLYIVTHRIVIRWIDRPDKMK